MRIRLDAFQYAYVEEWSEYETKVNRWNKQFLPNKVFVINSTTSLVKGGPEEILFSANNKPHKRRLVHKTYIVRKDGIPYIRFEFEPYKP